MRLRATTDDDLDFVVALEAAADVAPYVDCWSRERHRQAIVAPDEAHLLVVEDDRPHGFLLLAGLLSEPRWIELRRIVVEPRGASIGRGAVALTLAHAFAELGAERVWLDVMPTNERARRTYAACGFGLADCDRKVRLADGRLASLLVMSISADAWALRGSGATGGAG
jgi:RimJ/RimL family protein N-acetyltransferase